VFLALRIAVVVFGIIWGIHRITSEDRWNDFVQAYHRMHIVVFAACVAIFIISMLIIALRWYLLLRTQAIFINFWAAARLYFLGWFYNNFMPSSVGGDLVRAWYVTKHTDKKFEGVLSVFVDRVIGLASTLIIATFFYLFFMRGQGKPLHFESQIGFLKKVVFWAIIVILVLFGVLLVHKRGRSVLAKGWACIRVPAIRMITKSKHAAVLYCRKPLVLLAAFWLTVLLQMMVITGFWLLALDMGIETSVKYYYVFFTLVWVLGAAPVSIGGMVVVEGMLVFLFVQYAGVLEGDAWAIAISQRLVWWLASLPGAVIHLIGAHLPKDFFIDYNKSMN
jgi:hypothetical protein